jgi:RNA polymerase sigma factor (sigma-70 family)
MKDISKYSEYELQEIIRNNHKHKEKAFEYFFDKYSAELNTYCHFRSSSVSDAEEIFNDTWMKFLDYINKGFTIQNIKSYLYLSARNLIIDSYRKDAALKNVKIDYKDNDEIEKYKNEFDLEKFLEKEEMLSLIKIAVDMLDERYKDPFMMYWFGGLTHREIADITNDNRENIKIICYRAMKKVINILKPYLVEIKG